jgi:hypothetical protein
LKLIQFLFRALTDVTSIRVPSEQSFAEKQRPNDLLQIIRRQFIIKEGSACPTQLEFILEFIDDLIVRTHARKQNERLALVTV